MISVASKLDEKELHGLVYALVPFITCLNQYYPEQTNFHHTQSVQFIMQTAIPKRRFSVENQEETTVDEASGMQPHKGMMSKQEGEQEEPALLGQSRLEDGPETSQPEIFEVGM